MPDNLGPGAYKLKVQGTHGLKFTNEADLDYEAKSVSIFIQTDKAIYKPGQKGISNRDICHFLLYLRKTLSATLTYPYLIFFLILVNFRAFAIHPNMNLFTGSLDIEIYVSTDIFNFHLSPLLLPPPFFLLLLMH